MVVYIDKKPSVAVVASHGSSWFDRRFRMMSGIHHHQRLCKGLPMGGKTPDALLMRRLHQWANVPSDGGDAGASSSDGDVDGVVENTGSTGLSLRSSHARGRNPRTWLAVA